MGYNYRCTLRSKCGTRRSLKHPLHWYRVEPTCKGCGKNTLKFDHSVRRQTLSRGCFCRGSYWPHNKGSIVDENHTCIRASAEDLTNAELGFFNSRRIPRTEPCPF